MTFIKMCRDSIKTKYNLPLDLSPFKHTKNNQLEYEKIQDVITSRPGIMDILKLKIPFNEKCQLFEKILILDNTFNASTEYMKLKRNLVYEIDRCENTMSEQQYKDFEKKELLLSTINEKMPIKYRILSSCTSDQNIRTMYKKYKQLCNLTCNSSEYPKLKKWIECALDIPSNIKPLAINHTSSNKKISQYLLKIKNKLDSNIYGLTSVKEQLLFILNNKITNNKLKGSSMAITGPPGTAKTSIIQSIATAMDLPMVQISLGGAKDASFLTGHSYTYEGSAPGVIVDSLKRLDCKNGIIYFDEFDKISDTPKGSEVSKSLLHITDFTQNDKFKDKYLSNDIEIDLSHIWFIYSLNDKNALNSTLRDRIPILEIPGYTKKEKYEIAVNHLIPKILQNFNFNIDPPDVIFTDKILTSLISITDSKSVKDKTGKSGVRQLIHALKDICMKISIMRNTVQSDGSFGGLNLSCHINNFKLPIVINKVIFDILYKETESFSGSSLNMYM
jgi:ATP-dependent Lon protease